MHPSQVEEAEKKATSTGGPGAEPPNSSRDGPATERGGSVSEASILSLARARLLLWATPRGQKLAYEVSKAVNAPLQVKCKTAPLCPGESPQDGLPGWIQPNGAPVGACPYHYETRGECISDRNIEALVAALFLPAEARLVSNYMNALGYNVREEEFPPESLDGARILNAHARISSSHEVRVMGAPGVGEIVLVRDLADDR